MEDNDNNESSNSSIEENENDVQKPEGKEDDIKEDNDKDEMIPLKKEKPLLMINTIKKYIGSDKLDMGVTCLFYAPLVLHSEKLQEFLNENSNHGLTGLKNLGNTSYFNSIIQCLSHCPDLVYYYIGGLYKNDLANIPAASSSSSLSTKQKGTSK